MLNQHFTLRQLRKTDPDTFRSLLEQELYACIPGERQIPSKHLSVAVEVAEYAGRNIAEVFQRGNRTFFNIRPKIQWR